MAINATYVSNHEFTVTGDRTAYLRSGLRIQALMGVDGIEEATVVSSTYSSGPDTTTCTIAESVLTPNLATIKIGATYADPDSSSTNIGAHDHNPLGGYLPAAVMSEAEVEIATSIPVPDTGDAKKYVEVLDTENGYELRAFPGTGNQIVGQNSGATDIEGKTLSGTANQVTVTHAAGSITLATPQNIHSAATPTFAGLTITGTTGILEGKGASAIGVVASTGALQVLRRNAANNAYEFADLPIKGLSDVADAASDNLAIGDILVGVTGPTWSRLGKGSDGHILHVSSGAPAWVELDGDKVDIDWNPANYTPSVPAEADDADDLAAHLKGIDNELGLISGGATSGPLCDAVLERTDVNTVQLAGKSGTSKLVWVNGSSVDCSTTKTLDTDSESEYVITGTTTVAKGTALNSYTGGNYNNYGLHYLYLCNNDACWNFSGYDRRNQLIMSAEAPTSGGYLAASGDGVNARHVGWIILNSSRQMLEPYYLASTYNLPDTLMLLSGDLVAGTSTSESSVVYVDNDTEGSPRKSDYIIIPAGWAIAVVVSVMVKNSLDNKMAYYRLYGDDGFSCGAGCQWISGADRYVGTGGGVNFKRYSSTTVVFFKTQTGAQSVGGSSGTAYSSDMAQPTVLMTRKPSG